MSIVKRSVDRLFGRDESAEAAASSRVQAAGYLAVREGVWVAYEPSIQDLVDMYDGLPPDTQHDPAIVSLYDAAAEGRLPVADVVQYIQAYDAAVHHEYNG